MDRSLDETIASRQRNTRGSRGPRRQNNAFPRDGVRKSNPRDTRDLDQDWVHDRYDDDETEPARPRRGGDFRSERQPNRSPAGRAGSGFKLKIENLHYEITEDDLRELFSRVGRVQNLSLVYDRQDRSTGVAYVTYAHLEDAIQAMNEFNGQNAYDQPIYLTMLPSKDGAAPARRDIDAPRGSRSLFDRIEKPGPGRRGRDRDQRSLSPAEPVRRSDVRKPAPEHIDRYVPSSRDNSRRRSPIRRGGGAARNQGRRPGARREQSRRDDSGHKVVQGRPRKNKDELDAEMEDYWNHTAEPANAENAPTNGNAAAAAAPAPAPATVPAPATGGGEDIDMIE